MSGHLRRRGKRSWEIKFDIGRDEATGRRLTQFHSVKGTRKDAEFKLAELVNSVGRGAYVGRSKLTVFEHVTARIDQWDALGRITPKTAERYRELLTNQIAPHIGPVVLQKLKPANIEQWHATLKVSGRKDGKGGLSARTIGHAHRLLSKALKEGVRHDLVIRNVAATEPPPKVGTDEVIILEAEQVKGVIAKLRGRAMYPRVITTLFTGLRRGELLALRWSRIDLDSPNKQLQVREAIEETKAAGIRFKTPKTKNSVRDVSLPDVVVEALRNLRRQQLELRMALGMGKMPDDALVFPRSNGSPQSPRAFSKEWSDVADSIGFPEITFHAFRHTHVSHLIDAGIDVVKISRRIGHASPTITLKIYAHLFRKRDDQSTDAINTAVGAFLEG
ncbi:MAG TPA: site-specific integrase [Tepidisphaeraceae bacterium]|nr:site-specific integrase [Tepidisphaeraceae bacterium]